MSVCCEWEEAGAPQEGAEPQAALTDSGDRAGRRERLEIPVPLGVSKLMPSTSQMLCKVHTQAGTRPELLMQSMYSWSKFKH